jgi:hypothetical protein
MGSLYTGEFVQDKKHGKGKLQYATGHEYDGMWKDDLPCMSSFSFSSNFTFLFLFVFLLGLLS